MPTEFQLIDKFLAPFARRGAGVVLGPGDDCAVLRPSPKRELCVTTDAVVEGVHFDPAYCSDADIGFKALAVNLSDLAAMGAEPRWFVCSLACRPSDTARVPRIARGMAALAARAGAVLVGGNFTRAEALSLHLTVAGELPPGTALTRSGAKPGDLLYVTGTLGDAALGLAALRIGRAATGALSRQLRPEPRLAAGQVARRFAHAAIDLSDGLLQDLGHVAAASGVALRVDPQLLPLSRAFHDLAANLDLALTGGEDYELALLVPPHEAMGFERACAKAEVHVTRIGEASRGRGVGVAGATRPRGRRGFDHFR